MLKSSSVVREKEFNSTKKQTTAAILITISLLFIIINRLDSGSLPLTHGITFSRCQDRRPNTQTHTVILIHLLTSQSLTVRSAAQL